MCYNVYKVSESDVKMLDLQKENVETLAALKLKETKKELSLLYKLSGNL